VELLLARRPLGDALGAVASEFELGQSETEEIGRQVLSQIEKNCFYSDAEVIEDTQESFPILCYLSKFCNLACTHCYAEAGPTVTTSNDLTSAEWARVFADYAEVLGHYENLPGKITLTGGEPLVRPDLFEILEAAGSHGIFLELFSNGTLIKDDAFARRLAESVTQAQISLDGATEPVNDAIRGQGSYRRIMRGLGFLAKTDIKIRLAVTLMPANAEDLAENLIAAILPFGKNRIEIRISLANVQGRADSSVRFSDAAEGERVLRQLLSRLYDQGMRRPRKIVSNFQSTSCGYGRSINVASDGTVYACAIESCPIGNVRKTPLTELGPIVNRLDAETLVDKIAGCASCELRYFCNGGCRLNNYSYRGNLFTTCCTREKKDELLGKLVHRELVEDYAVSRMAKVGGFWY